MNSVSFTGETMVPSETPALLIHFRWSTENPYIWLLEGAGYIFFYSALIFAWKMRSEWLAFLYSFQRRKFLRSAPRRKTLTSNAHISCGSYQHILRAPTNLILQNLYTWIPALQRSLLSKIILKMLSSQRTRKCISLLKKALRYTKLLLALKQRS